MCKETGRGARYPMEPVAQCRRLLVRGKSRNQDTDRLAAPTINCRFVICTDYIVVGICHGKPKRLVAYRWQQTH